jgi:hypothetical protein
MPSPKRKKEDQMATPRVRQKSAMETLLDSMNELADSAAKKMTVEEMRKTSKEINESIDRVVSDGRRRRRETA